MKNPAVSASELKAIAEAFLYEQFRGTGITIIRLRQWGGQCWGEYMPIKKEFACSDAIEYCVKTLAGRMAARIKHECESAGLHHFAMTRNLNNEGFASGIYAECIDREDALEVHLGFDGYASIFHLDDEKEQSN